MKINIDLVMWTSQWLKEMVHDIEVMMQWMNLE